MHWALLGDSSASSTSGAAPLRLPTPGSAAETDLIQRLAEAEVEREQSMTERMRVECVEAEAFRGTAPALPHSASSDGPLPLLLPTTPISSLVASPHHPGYMVSQGAEQTTPEQKQK